MSKYGELFKDPRWQKKRLEILERDNWSCRKCYDSETTLHVHHRVYNKNANPWDYHDTSLITLCDECHKVEHESINECKDILVKAVLSAGFLAEDLVEIALGFSHIDDPAAVAQESGVAACALGWFLSQKGTLGTIVDLYWAEREKQRKRKESGA